MNPFQVEISTQNNSLFQGTAVYVGLTSFDGSLGITSNTTHLLGVLKPCYIAITTDDKNESIKTFPCTSGFYFKCDKILKIILQ